MNVSIISHFRNASSYIERYCNQMDELQSLLLKDGHSLRLVLGYGDSTDATNEILFEECLHRFDCALVDVSHGGPSYGSIVHHERFKQLARIGNFLWSHHYSNADIVGLVESDLIWEGATLQSLVRHVGASSRPVMVAPMVMHLDGRFYDTWAFRRGLRAFVHQPPHHPVLLEEDRYIEMDSVGSVLFMKGSWGRGLHWPEEDVVVGFCKQAEAIGVTLHLDKESKVYHP